MKIDINNALTVFSGLLMVVGAIYRLAQVEANINSRITRLESTINRAVDELKDSLVDRLNSTEKKLDIHLTEYTEKKLFAEYRHNATDKLIEHKFNRLKKLINQLAGFLNKESGFILRDDEY